MALLGSRMNDGHTGGSEISAFAKKQMEKMGWTEGKGLGKTESGNASHIKVKKMEDNEGLGAKAAKDEKAEEDATWWHDGFASGLAKMHKKHGKKGKKDKKDKKDKSDKKEKSRPPSYEELFAATGGARLGMRARADQSGKFKRSETIDSHHRETAPAPGAVPMKVDAIPEFIGIDENKPRTRSNSMASNASDSEYNDTGIITTQAHTQTGASADFDSEAAMDKKRQKREKKEKKEKKDSKKRKK